MSVMNLQSSSISNTREKKLQCPYCPRKSFRQDNWKRHMNTMHPQMQPRTVSASTEVPFDGNSINTIGPSVTNNDPQISATTSGAPVVFPSSSCPRTHFLISYGQPDPDRDGTRHIAGCDECWSRISMYMFTRQWFHDILRKAISKNREQLVEHLMSVRDNVRDDQSDEEYRAAMQLAHKQHTINPAIIVALCKYKPLARDTDGTYGRVLLKCCNKNSDFTLRDICAMVQALLDAGADANIKGDRGRLALHEFIESTNDFAKNQKVLDDSLEMLIRATTDINCSGVDGATPLSIASRRSLAAVRILLNYRADPTKESYGLIPLQEAKCHRVAELLIRWWPSSVYHREEDYTGDSLENSLFDGNKEIIHELLKYHQSLENHPPSGIYMSGYLNEACWEQDEISQYCYLKIELKSLHEKVLEICPLILEKRCNPNSRERGGSTVLKKLIAKWCSLRDEYKIPFVGGNDKEASEILENNLKSVSLLLRYGADPSIPDDKGESPLGILISKLKKETREYRTGSVSGCEPLEMPNFIGMVHWMNQWTELGRHIALLQDAGGRLTATEQEDLLQDIPNDNLEHDFVTALVYSAIMKSCSHRLQ